VAPAQAFTYPIYLVSSTSDTETLTFVSTFREVGEVPVCLIIVLFFSVSAALHMVWECVRWLKMLYFPLSPSYNKWLNFAISSSLLLLIVALTFGVSDLGALLPMIGCNIAMSYFLLAFEQTNMTAGRNDDPAQNLAGAFTLFIGAFAYDMAASTAIKLSLGWLGSF